MINQIDQVFYRAIRKEDTGINFLWLPYNGLFEYLFTQFDFVNSIYANKNDICHEWRSDYWTEKVNFLPSINFIDNPIDICVANHRQSQAFMANETAKSFHMPLVLIDHEPAAEGSRSGMIGYINKKMPKDIIFVPTHNLVKDSWLHENSSDVIEYGFKLCNRDIQKKNKFLLIGDYAESDANFINIVKSLVPEIQTSGYNINTEAYGSVENLINNISKSKISISAAQSIEPPLLQLLSASQNCLVVTSLNKWTESVFEHGKTALLYRSIDELKNIIKQIKKEEIDIDEIVYNARDMVDQNFNFETSQSKWKKLLTDISNRTFVI